MRWRNLLFWAMLTAVLTLTAVAVGAADKAHHAPPPPSDPRFDFLKSLAGTWVGTTAEPGMPEGIFEFRITAGGHAVEEREMVGTPMEMLTVYHMDGKDLVATHYCMLGNRPRVRAAQRVVDRSLDFECDGTPGNAKSHDEEHVHGWTMRIDDEGHLHYGGQLVKAGTVTHTPEFVLARQQSTASR